MDMSHYKDLFVSESREHLQTINKHVLALENDPGDRNTLDALFRVAHSIKGMAASMGYSDISELAHKLEDLMDRLRKGPLLFDALAADLFLEGADLLEGMIGDVEQNVTGDRNAEDLVRRIVNFPNQDEPPKPSTGVPAHAPAPPVEAIPPEGEQPQSIRVKTELLDSLIDITGELITNKFRLFAASGRLGNPALDEACLELGKLLRSLHDNVMKARLIPFSHLADGFPRVIRDVARKTGKEITLSVTGKEVELDRGVLEALSDPLIHILRNAADHGIEPLSKRIAGGKPPKGHISLSVSREKDQVLILVEDDGKGMEPGLLTSSAVKKGLLTAEQATNLSRHDALMLICRPGFSTADEVTDVSGRGVGMDAVKSAVQLLGGKLTIESVPGKGSSFSICVPAGIAIMQTLVVCCGTMKLAVPVSAIIQTRQLERDMVLKKGKQSLFIQDGESIPLLSLGRILHLQTPPEAAEAEISVIICEMRGRKFGLVVDRFLFQHELFVKPLGRPLVRLKGLMGNAILGDGEIVYVLDVPNLL